MNYSRKMFTIFCISGTALFAPGLAQAEDAPPAIQAWLGQIERQTQIKPTYDSLETDGDSATITNLSITRSATGNEPGFSVKIAEAEFSGMEDEGEGLHQIGAARFSNMTLDVTSPEFSLAASIPEASSEGWYVAEAPENATPAQAMRAAAIIARKMEAGKITITAHGQTVTADGMTMTWDGDPKTGAGTYDSKISNIAIPESLVAMADQGGFLKQLGYTSLSFDISGKGQTAIKSDTVDYAFDAGLTGHEIGSVKLGLAALGIPMTVFSELEKAQQGGKEPDFTALMPQIQAISIANASLRFEDASITRKLLPMLAAMQGMDEKTMLASAGPMLQMGLMQLQNQAFAEQTSKAVNAFLNDPKSITIAAKPVAPVKVSEMMALNPNTPGEAITKLGISVSSND